MGMYDYLVSDEIDYASQIKVFYHPIFDENGKEWFGRPTWHSGGLLETYKVGDKVPIKTCYYEYPESFYIYIGDYEEEQTDLALIKNGVFVGFIKNYQSLTEFLPFYSYYGQKVKAESLEDFARYVQEYKDEYKKDLELRNFKIFADRWYEKEPDWYLLGELLECWTFEKGYGDKIEKYGKHEINHKRKREAMESEIREFAFKHPIIYDDYMKKFKLDPLSFLVQKHE